MPNLLNLTILNPFIICWDNIQTGAVLLQKGKLLQSGRTIITNRVDSCYYKVGQELLQSGTDIRKCDNFIKKWLKYYKVGELL